MHPDLLNNSVFLKYYRQWQENPSSVVFAPIAEFFLRYGMINEAAKTCEDGLKKHPDFVSGQIVMAKVQIKRGDLESAKHILTAILSKTPNNESATKLMLEISPSWSSGWVESKAEVLPETILNNVVNPQKFSVTPENDQEEETTVRRVLPEELESDEEDYSEVATPVYAQVAGETRPKTHSPSWETVTMANIYLAQGHAQRAKEIFESILKRDPSNEQARRGLEELASRGG